MRFNKFKNILFTSSKVEDGNMSFKKGSPKEVLKNRRRFLKALGINLNQIVTLAPIHGSKIVIVDKKDLGKGAKTSLDAIEADGLITNQSGIYLFLKTGDCIPLGIFDPTNKVVGMAHASRESLESGILKNTIMLMQLNYKSDPKNLVANFGPSIGPCCYIRSYPKKSNGILKPYTKKIAKASYSIDIWSLAKDQLFNLGLKIENIHNPQLCTYHNNQYFSHRKAINENLENDFRFASVI